MNVMRVMVFMGLLFTVPVVSASCQQAVEPAIPDPDYANIEEVLETQRAVKYYIKRQEAYLACNRNPNKHNAVVKKMHEVARKFNTMARRFKTKKQAEDMFTELVYLEIPLQL